MIFLGACLVEMYKSKGICAARYLIYVGGEVCMYIWWVHILGWRRIKIFRLLVQRLDIICTHTQ
jgi:hypothetical protein